jgi:hypothetical protein
MARLLAAGEPKFVPPGETRTSLTAHARQRLAEARTAARDLPAALLPAFLPVALTDLYLKGRPSQFRRQLKLWWSARHERF